MEKLFCALGKSGVGKDAIVSMTKDDLHMPIATSFTTRPMRDGEVDGREYHFITEEEFNELKESNQLAEYTEYNVADNSTWYYGLTKKELESHRYLMVIVNPHGLEQLTEIYGDKVVSILIECDDMDRIKRSINRDGKIKPKELCRRFLADEDDFENISYDYAIDNTERVIDAVNRFKKILVEEMCSL